MQVDCIGLHHRQLLPFVRGSSCDSGSGGSRFQSSPPSCNRSHVDHADMAKCLCPKNLTNKGRQSFHLDFLPRIVSCTGENRMLRRVITDHSASECLHVVTLAQAAVGRSANRGRHATQVCHAHFVVDGHPRESCSNSDVSLCRRGIITRTGVPQNGSKTVRA